MHRGKKKRQKDIQDEGKMLDCVDIENVKTIKLIKSNKPTKECEHSGHKKRTSTKKKFINDNEMDCRKMLTIRPSMGTREKILGDRHLLCLSEGAHQLVSKNPEEIVKRYQQQLPNKKISKMKKKKSKKGTEEQKSNNEKSVDQETTEAEGDAETREEKGNDNLELDRKDKTDEKETKKKINKKKKRMDNMRKKGTYKNDVESSECDTVCSFDSEICLAGLALTVEDERKIRKNRHKLLSSNAS